MIEGDKFIATFHKQCGEKDVINCEVNGNAMKIVGLMQILKYDKNESIFS